MRLVDTGASRLYANKPKLMTTDRVTAAAAAKRACGPKRPVLSHPADLQGAQGDLGGGQAGLSLTSLWEEERGFQ